jgi:site-specific recombinase XerD
VYGNSWAPATRKSFLFDLRTFFAWAVKRGHLLASPAAPVDFPTLSPDPPGIHTPEQVRQVLETARRLDPDVCRHFALRYFAGLRRSEAAALGEECLRAEYVEVPAARAKTRRRRLIPIRPALRAWLAVGGSLPLTDANSAWRRSLPPAAFPGRATRRVTRFARTTWRRFTARGRRRWKRGTRSKSCSRIIASWSLARTRPRFGICGPPLDAQSRARRDPLRLVPGQHGLLGNAV